MLSALVEITHYETYVLISDDCIVSQEALDAVLELAEQHPVVTGWCRLDSTSPLSNLTSSPFTERESRADDYSFYPAATVCTWPVETLPTYFAGFALTAMSRDLWQRFPFRCSTPTGAADHSLALRLADAGIPITAARDGYVQHVKERWGRLDAHPAKRLLIGEVEPNVTLITSESKEEIILTDKIAQEDITDVNELGQTVVLVPKGQPIPEGLETKPKAQASSAPARKVSARKRSK